MKNNINDEIRKCFFKQINSQLEHGVPVNMYSAFLTNQLYDMRKSKDDYQVLMYNAFVSIAYIDTYKILNYRMQNNDFNLGDDMQTIEHIDRIDDFDDLLSEVSVDYNFLELLIHYFYEFSTMPITARVLMVKNLTQEDNKHLLNITPMHQNDLDMYGKQLSASFFTFYYNNMVKVITEESVYYGYDLNHVLENIEGFIKQLNRMDSENTIDIIKEMMILDYKYLKYLLDNKKIKNNIDFYEKLTRVSLMEDKELQVNDIVNLYLENRGYLSQLVESYIDITSDDIRSIYGKEVTPLLVEVYTQAKIPEEVKQKLM